MDWQPQCPEINITDAAWDRLYREQNKWQSLSKEVLCNVLQEGWKCIPEDYIIKLQESFPK